MAERPLVRRDFLPDGLTELNAKEVATFLGLSRTRVQVLLTSGRLKARFDKTVPPRGCWWFTRQSVEQLKIERETVPLTHRSMYARGAIAHEGVVAARAFELFGQGKTIAEVVQILCVKPDRIRRLYTEYKTPLGQRVMTPEAERELFERQRIIKELDIADARVRAAMLNASKPNMGGKGE